MFLTITELETVKLYEIIELLLEETKKLFVVCNRWDVGNLNDHFVAYEVISKSSDFLIIEIECFDGPPISLHNIMNRLYFQKTHDFLCMNVN